MKNKIPKSIRKFIRKEKARIRREFPDTKEQTEQIENLYKKFLKEKNNADTRNI